MFSTNYTFLKDAKMWRQLPLLATILMVLLVASSPTESTAGGLVYTPAPHKKNILFVTFDAGGHFSSYTGLWDGLARRGHDVTVAFPKIAHPWFVKARELYENQNLTNLHSLHTGEGLVKKMLDSKEVEEVGDAGVLRMIQLLYTALKTIMEGQISILDDYMKNNHVDAIVHDDAILSGPPLCKKYNIPCISASVIFNNDSGVMNFWRPPMGIGFHPATPSFLERLSLPLANFASRAFLAIMMKFVYQRVDELLNNTNADLANQLISDLFTLCPKHKMKLVSVPPSLDQAQITPPSVIFVGPMRDMQRYEPLRAQSSEQAFLDGAASNGVPVVFMAAGVTAPILDEYNVERLAIIRELTKDGRVHVLWANKKGLTDDELASVPGGTNVMMVSKYLPQEAVLNHPAVKVFVTHGGSTSMMEGVAAGVPFLCSPYAFEQINNCMLLEHRQMGIHVPKGSAISTFVSGIHSLLDDHADYSQQVMRVWNHVVTYGEGEDAYGARRAVRLVESAAHNGIDFLAPEVCGWPVYQQLHLDVIGLYLLVGMLGIWVCYVLWKRFGSTFKGKKKVD